MSYFFLRAWVAAFFLAGVLRATCFVPRAAALADFFADLLAALPFAADALLLAAGLAFTDLAFDDFALEDFALEDRAVTGFALAELLLALLAAGFADFAGMV